MVKGLTRSMLVCGVLVGFLGCSDGEHLGGPPVGGAGGNAGSRATGGTAGGAGAAGGAAGAIPHVWVANVALNVPPGYSACVEGPYYSPSGANLFYDISDTVNDDMAVSIVANGNACDGSTGYGTISSTNWTSGASGFTTGALPGGAYLLAITCYNVAYDCTPFLSVFGYQQ